MASLLTPAGDAPARSWRHGAIVGATASIGAASATFALSSGLAALIARQVVVPPKVGGKLTVLKLENDPNSGQPLITLPANTDTRAAGTYALRFDEGQSMARLSHFGHYLRLRAEMPDNMTGFMLATLSLKA